VNRGFPPKDKKVHKMIADLISRNRRGAGGRTPYHTSARKCSNRRVEQTYNRHFAGGTLKKRRTGGDSLLVKEWGVL